MKPEIRERLRSIAHELALLEGAEHDVPVPDDIGAALDGVLEALRRYSDRSHPVTAESVEDERLLAVTDTLMAMAALDFGHTVPVDGSGDVVDAVAMGVNMLAEELEHSVVSRTTLDQERKRYRDLFEQSAEALMTVSPPSWRFTSANSLTLRMYGVGTEAEFMEMGPWDVSPELQPDGSESAVKAREMMERAVEEGSVYFDWTHRRLDGTEFPATVLLASMEINGEQVVLATVRDVTEKVQAQKAIRESEEKFKALYDNMSGGVAVYRVENDGQDFIITDMNRGGELIEGVSRDDVMGHNVVQVFPGIRDMGLLDVLRRVWKSGTPEHVPAAIYRNGDREMWRENYVYRLPSGYVVAVYDDVTDRKRAEEKVRKSEEQLRDLFENAGDMIQSVRPDGTFLYVNKAWLKALEYTNEELGRMTVFDVLDEECRSKCKLAFKQVMEGEEIDTVEACFRTKSGHKLVVEGNVSCRTDDNGVAVSTRAIFRDVTDRKAAEEKLARTMDELKRSNQELTDFAHIASHDLKEPLRKVMTFGERIRSTAKGLDERSTDYLGRMQNAAERMAGLLDGLLEYARVTTKGKPFETVDLNTVAAEVLRDLEVRVAETGADVIVEALPAVQADPLQMRQLLQNLIGNALKYHKPDVKPVISVSGTVAGGMCELRIEDNGIGIAPADHEKAFGVFQRLVGKNEYEGTGVGLSICKKIVERHGGTIIIESEPGNGTAFIFTLPPVD